MKIPENKIIEFKEAHDSWKLLNPDYEIRYWSGEDCEKYLSENFGERYLKVFRKIKPYAYKSDFFSYCVVLKEGGWYSDWKQKTYINLDSIIGDNDFICFHDHGSPELNYRRSVACGFFGSVKNNPIIELTIEQILFNVENNLYGLHPLDPTGPYIFGKALWTFLENDDYKILFGIYKANFYSIENKIIVKHKTDNKIYNKNWENGNNYAEMWHQKDIYN
jgi:mannosyltransferase OCH1-like enzyme